MSSIASMAAIAAELDFHEICRSKSDWLALTSCVRSGISVGPAADALASVGRSGLCRVWGVSESAWHIESGRWFYLYNTAWCAAVEAMCARQEGQP